ncbi:hypothetical protein AURDEDRAFT_164778 [Auricularia subglabra TFB-10046 SS5]|nr:hypothetical protein AURDEDRAFT_164778 [Auricularia subglabra TFB-10046 SS5]
MAASSEHSALVPLATFLPSTAEQVPSLPGSDAQLLDWQTLGCPPIPAEVFARYGRNPTHVIIDSGANVGYVFDSPPLDMLAVAQTTVRGEGPCQHGCAPHVRAPCPGRRRQTPYPSSAERATSRSSTPSSHSSMPSLMEVSDSSASESDSPDQPQPDRNVERARDNLRESMDNLELSGLRERLRRQRLTGFGPVYEAVREILLKEQPRGTYPSWPMIEAAYDGYTMVEAIQCLISELLDVEPHFHPDQPAPAGQVLYDYIIDIDFALSLVHACHKVSSARKAMEPQRKLLYQARRRITSLFDSGCFLDEGAGTLARDLCPPRDQYVQELRAREVMDPIDTVMRVLQAVSDLAFETADRHTRYE